MNFATELSTPAVDTQFKVIEAQFQAIFSPEADDRPQPANPGFCCAICGQGFDFGCRCPDY